MKKIQAHKTAIHRKKPSLTVKTLENQGVIKNRVFDFGCGVGSDVDYLKSKNYQISFWDPFYFPENPPLNYKANSFQTIFCTYILNVVSKNERTKAIKEIQRLLKKNGHVFFTVRSYSDIVEKAKENSWKKQSDGWITKRGTFQKGFKAIELELLLRKEGFKHVVSFSKNPLIVECSN